MKINGSEVPVGSVFEVMYPRRRENNQVALHFLDVKVKKRKGTGRTKGRFSKADALIQFKRLTHCELVHPGNEMEYFIRIAGTDKLWLGHRGEVLTDHEGKPLATRALSKPRFCDEAGWDHANHYVSLNNAITGVVTIMFKHYATLDKIGREVQSLEIVGRNPIRETIMETHPIGGDWWANVVALARVGRAYKTDKTVDTPRTRLQRLASAIPMDCPKWNFVALFSNSYVHSLKDADTSIRNGRKCVMEKLNEIGFHEGYHLQGEGDLLFNEDSDRVLLKLAMNDKDVDIHNL